MAVAGRRRAGWRPAGRLPPAAAATAANGPYASLVERVAALIEHLRVGRRALVAVDGPDAAGKTTFARDLADRLARPALSASIDGWHHPREMRLRRGHESAEGYYLDSFDDDALVRECLDPFASGADRVRTAMFDHGTFGEVEALHEVPADAVLIFDGVFLLRPALRGRWDLSVYLHVPESVTLARAVQRDLQLFGTEENVRRRYERRYLPGQDVYRKAAAPLDHADIVIDNSHPADPVVLRWPTGAEAGSREALRTHRCDRHGAGLRRRASC